MLSCEFHLLSVTLISHDPQILTPTFAKVMHQGIEETLDVYRWLMGMFMDILK